MSTGNFEAAEKTSSDILKWDWSGEDVGVVEKILEWAKEKIKSNELYEIKADKSSFALQISHGGFDDISLIRVWKNGRVMIPVEFMHNKGPARPYYKEEASRKTLIEQFKRIFVDEGTPKRRKHNPTMKLSYLYDDDTRKRFLSTIQWEIGQIKAS